MPDPEPNAPLPPEPLHPDAFTVVPDIGKNTGRTLGYMVIGPNGNVLKYFQYIYQDRAINYAARRRAIYEAAEARRRADYEAAFAQQEQAEQQAEQQEQQVEQGEQVEEQAEQTEQAESTSTAPAPPSPPSSGSPQPAPAPSSVPSPTPPTSSPFGLSPEELKRVSFFRTAQGSLYARHPDTGQTIRIKSDHSALGHESTDAGLKAASERTVYIPTDVASGLSAAGLEGVTKARVLIRDGKASLATWNAQQDRWGTAPSGRDVPFSTAPQPGLSPLELWKSKNDVPGFEAAYSSMHAGSEITGEVSAEEGLRAFQAAMAARAQVQAASTSVSAAPPPLPSGSPQPVSVPTPTPVQVPVPAPVPTPNPNPNPAQVTQNGGGAPPPMAVAAPPPPPGPWPSSMHPGVKTAQAAQATAQRTAQAAADRAARQAERDAAKAAKQAAKQAAQRVAQAAQAAKQVAQQVTRQAKQATQAAKAAQTASKQYAVKPPSVPTTSGIASGFGSPVNVGLTALSIAAPEIGIPLQLAKQVGEELVDLPKRLRDFSESVHRANLEFVPFAPRLGLAEANLQLNDLYRRMGTARDTEVTATTLTNAVNEMRESLYPFQVVSRNAQNTAATFGASVVAGGASGFNDVFAVLEGIRKALDPEGENAKITGNVIGQAIAMTLLGPIGQIAGFVKDQFGFQDVEPGGLDMPAWDNMINRQVGPNRDPPLHGFLRANPAERRRVDRVPGN